MQAKSIAYSDSASGHYVEEQLFDKLGIKADVSNKATMIEKTPVASVVAKGDYALGFQQVSELLPIEDAEFIGRIPDEVQYVTRFAGAVVAASPAQQQSQQLLCYLSSASVQKEVSATGLDPVSVNNAVCH